jgi:hypothetical protein
LAVSAFVTGLVVISALLGRVGPGVSMLIVMISVGRMPMSFVNEVGVVPVLHCRVPATWCMLVGVALGDGVRSRQLIVVDQLR